MDVHVDAGFINQTKGIVIYVALFRDEKHGISKYAYFIKRNVRSNNVAEYEALEVFLQYIGSRYGTLIRAGEMQCTFHTDSHYALREIQEDYSFKHVKFSHVPRLTNPINTHVHMLVQQFRGRKLFEREMDSITEVNLQ